MCVLESVPLFLQIYVSGEGTSSTGGAWPGGDPSGTFYPSDDAMDVDECMAAASSGLNLANDVLSPPASNERVDQFSQVCLIVVSGVLSVGSL